MRGVGYWAVDGDQEAFLSSHLIRPLLRLYRELPGVWFVNNSLTESFIREHVRDPRFCRIEQQSDPVYLLKLKEFKGSNVSASLRRHRIEALISSCSTLRVVETPFSRLLSAWHRPIHYFMLPHGRSGKYEPREQHGRRDPDGLVEEATSVRRGNATFHNLTWSRHQYLMLDDFLLSGGSFTHEIPRGRLRVLLAPTHLPPGEPGTPARSPLTGSILAAGSRWQQALRRLAGMGDLHLSPHPKSLEPFSNGPEVLRRFLAATGAELLHDPSVPTHARIPDYHCVVSDISGVMWEALMFDTPVILPVTTEALVWDNIGRPSRERFAAVVPCVGPERLVETVLSAASRRAPRQRALAEMRLGVVDGRNSQRLAARIRAVLS